MTGKNTNLNVDVTGDTAALERALKKSGADLKAYERDINSAKRALDQLEWESLKASATAARAERQLAKAADEHAAAQERAWKQTQQSGSALGSLVGAAALVGPAAAAAGAAIGAFGALAAPSIYKVVAAQADLGNQWVTLDHRQKIASISTQALVDDYKRLSKSYEPEALAAYNNVLSTTRSLLPEITPLARTGATAFNNLATQIGNSLTGPVWSNFFNTLSQRAIPDTQLLGNVAVNAGNAFAALTTDLLPLGETLLQGAGGVTKLLAELSQVSPTTVQLGVSMYALQKPAAALVGTAGSIASKFKGASGAVGLFGKSTKAASIGSGLLKDSAGGLPGIITGVVVVAGALALKFSSVKTAAELTTERITAQNQAFGNNVAGYQGAITATSAYLAHLKATNLEVHTSEQNLSTNGYAIRQVESALKTLTTQQHNVQVGERLLGQQYGISASQAGTLATAAGVDLSTAIDRNGRLTAQATAKIAQYRSAVALAQNPTRQIAIDLQTMANSSLDADTRLKALTAALDASINPSLAAFTDTTNLRQAQSQLAGALKKSHGEMGLQTAAARNSRAAFAAYIQQTVKLAQDQYQLDSRTMGAKRATDKYRSTIINSLPKLYNYAGHNRAARQQVDALARAAGLAPKQVNALRQASDHAAKTMKTAGDRATYMRKMINLIKNHVDVHIDVNADGAFTFTNKSYNPFGGGGGSTNVHRGKASGHAAGGGLVNGPGGARSDKAGLYALSHGEFVVNAPATSRHLPELMAMNDEGNRGTAYRPIGYAASGGFITAGNGSQKGMRWEHQQAVDATAIRAGQAFKKLMTSFPAGGGSRRWAPLVLQVLSMLGMSPSLVGGVLTLIQRESGGNPNAINLWDSNAKAGHPSQGLMQTIPGTFAAYAGPYRGLGITNPLANIYAGLNYIKHRYLSLAPLLPGWSGGYASGGRVVGPGGPRSDAAGLYALSNGEFVVNAPAARRNMGALLAMNEAGNSGTPYRTQGLAGGGAIGKSIPELEGTPKQIKAALKKIVKEIRDAFTGKRESSFVTLARHDVATLQKLAKQRDALTTKINSATSLSNSTKSSALDFASLSNLTGGGNAASVQAALTSRANSITHFASNIKKLKSFGLAPSLLSQIIAMGPDQGTAISDAILTGATKTSIAKLNHTQTLINQASAGLGNTAAAATYGTKISSGFIAGLTKQRNKLQAEMNKIAKSMGKQLARAIKLHGHASGGVIRAGELSLINERGPELLQPAAATRVYTAAQTKRVFGMAVRGGDGASATAPGNPMIGTLNVNHVPGYSTERDVVNATASAHRQLRLTRAR